MYRAAKMTASSALLRSFLQYSCTLVLCSGWLVPFSGAVPLPSGHFLSRIPSPKPSLFGDGTGSSSRSPSFASPETQSFGSTASRSLRASRQTRNASHSPPAFVSAPRLSVSFFSPALQASDSPGNGQTSGRNISGHFAPQSDRLIHRSPASPSSLQGLATASHPGGAADDAFESFRAETVALFPGQGAQTVGMGVASARQSAAAKAIFTEASEVVGRDMLKLCEEGPEAELHKTEWAQPALLTASMAAVARWKEEQESSESPAPAPSASLGLSLGEYSSLCFAGALAFPSAVHLTRQRGLLMQRAGESNGGGMAAVLGLSREEASCLRDAVNAVLQDRDSAEKGGELCEIANYLCQGNIVFSGSLAGLEVLEELASKKVTPEEAKARGFPKPKRVVRLKVSGAFHSCLMQEAAEGLRKTLEETEIQTPKIPVVMNVDARTHADPRMIKQQLMRQLTNPVLMDKSLELLVDRGMQEGFEFGPGGVLVGLMRKTRQEVKVHQVE
ncbi:acyl transferase domain-containing protein [Toxoplasma gondii TgCatPRC2]|uniref:Acyl transferase domain-containing protein n=1 Tax=Toxoplasma gondii TgCatPRC2 TaxID=1130821 RepID=A0A151GYK2_TOXGO|nr:acyl transferase domain-containing protein [Toxoplasma gondii TgCatPRC2]